MHHDGVRIKIPASTANIGPGFDTIGMAFQLYTTIYMHRADETQIRMLGNNLTGLPTDKSNLLYQVAAYLFQEAGITVPELYIEVSSDIPLTRGLGSSAAAIVGAFVAANLLAGEPFNTQQLFSMAAKWEGHPDNVGASFFGGIIVASMPNEGQAAVPYVSLPVPPSLRVLTIIPDFWLPTETARSVLPQSYSKEDVIFNISHSSLLVASFAQGRLDLLAEAMQDRIHQPYRAKLVPGLAELLLEATKHGALGTVLSGAGPTSLCFYQTEKEKASLVDFIETVMTEYQVSYQVMDLLPDRLGVQILRK